MPVRQRTVKGRSITITAEMLKLFRRGLALQKAGKTEAWEEDGGNRSEYLHRVGVRCMSP
jgi:hypothetical protein